MSNSRKFPETLADLNADKENPRSIPDSHLAGLKASLDEFGDLSGLTFNVRTGELVSGHQRVRALREQYGDALQVEKLDEDRFEIFTPEGERFIGRLVDWDRKRQRIANITANNPEIAGVFTDDLYPQLDELMAEDAELAQRLRLDELQLEEEGQAGRPEDAPALSLAQRFLLPPFSILDSRLGPWLERKRAWKALGILSDQGRERDLLAFSVPASIPNFYKKKTAYEQETGKQISTEDFIKIVDRSDQKNGTSIFDPVLAEVCYTWFGLPGGSVLDPFSGGSVRGVVAGRLGLAYTGVDLREEQVTENRRQAEAIFRDPASLQAPGAGEEPGVSPFVSVKISAKSARLRFHGCTPEYIASTCHARCCEASQSPTGISVAVGPIEAKRLIELGAEVVDGMVQPRQGEKKCPFKAKETHLCGLHGTPDKPFGCSASPFTVNKNRTLVVRNRYKLLKCYDDGPRLPAFVAFRASLDLLFGKQEAERICAHLELGGGDIQAQMPRHAFETLVEKNEKSLAQLRGEHAQPPSAAIPSAESGSLETAGPEWARGFPVPFLKSLRAVFSASDKGFTYGAFTGVKETQVAEWLAAGQVYGRQVDGRPVALVVAKQAKSGGQGIDFAGHLLGRVAVRDVQIKRVAAVKGWEGLLPELIEEASMGATRVWLEIWQEKPSDRLLAEYAGFRWLGSKIAASSEIVGVWVRGTVDGHLETPEAETFALCRLELPALDVAPLAEAIPKRVASWADHYSNYNKGHTWSALALRGYGGKPDFIIKPSEMAKSWKKENGEALTWEIQDTGLRRLLPEAEPLIAAIPGKKHRIRLMRLTSGKGELTRHADITDPDAGVEPGKLLRIHIPIVTNPEVRFEQWLLDGSQVAVGMKAGQAWYLDTRKPHTAVNRGETDRIHLVMDVESCPQLLALLQHQAPGNIEEVASLAKGSEQVTNLEIPASSEIPDRPPAGQQAAREPQWVTGNSMNLATLAPGAYDMIFSCPPYFDLEQYSDDPADLSNLSWERFSADYSAIIAQAVAQLKENRFAVFVVGDIRDKQGFYRNFVDLTKAAFEKSGARFYNDIVFVKASSNLALRAARPFQDYRKVGKMHQNVLVFFKGKASKIREIYGEVAIAELDPDLWEAEDDAGLGE